MNLSRVKDILSLYDKLKPSNSTSNYTVIATLCDSTTGELIALATGTAANNRINPDDIEDCHAESLVKRAFKRYTIDRLTEMLSTCASIEDFREKIEHDHHRDLSLFVSQFPCGLVRRYEGQEPIDEATGKPIKRKPGRGVMKDGRLVFVEKDHCAAKLKKWFENGIQGDKLKQLFGIENRIKEIVIGDCEQSDTFDYESHLDSFGKFLSVGQPPKVDVLRGVRHEDFIFRPDKQPQPVALVWWTSSKLGSHSGNGNKRHKGSPMSNYEHIVDGRKKGATKKQILSGNDIFKLRVGDYNMRKDLADLEKIWLRLHKQ